MGKTGESEGVIDYLGRKTLAREIVFAAMMFSIGFLQNCGFLMKKGTERDKSREYYCWQRGEEEEQDVLQFKAELKQRIRKEDLPGEKGELKEISLDPNLLGWVFEPANPEEAISIFIYDLENNYFVRVSCGDQTTIPSCLAKVMVGKERKEDELEMKKEIISLNLESTLKQIYGLSDDQLIKLPDYEDKFLFYFAKQSEKEGLILIYSTEENLLNQLACKWDKAMPKNMDDILHECVFYEIQRIKELKNSIEI